MGSDRFKFPVAKTICMDGFSVSIQGSRHHYSTPRNDEGPYTEVELGYPSAEPPDYILEFAEDKDNPTQTVYGYVPVELVERMIQEHGGRKVIAC